MSSSNPLVSVIIPCYNDKDYILETLKAVNNQIYRNIEIIIVDDGSNAQTKKILTEITYENTLIIEQKNSGPSVARNNGANHAKGEYLLILDADDTFDKTFLKKAVTILNKKPEVSAVSCYCNVFEKDYKITYKHKPQGGGLKEFLFDNNSTSFALIRKSKWDEISGYDEQMKKGFEDWEFWIRLTKNNGFVHIIPEFLFYYRNKKNSFDKIAKENFREKNLSYIYKKHKDIYLIYFDEVVDFISNLATRHKRNEVKYKESLDYRIGSVILKPFRLVRRILK